MVGEHTPISIVLLMPSSFANGKTERGWEREEKDGEKIISDLHLLSDALSFPWLVFFRHSPLWVDYVLTAPDTCTPDNNYSPARLHEELLIYTVSDKAKQEHVAFNTGSHFPSTILTSWTPSWCVRPHGITAEHYWVFSVWSLTGYIAMNILSAKCLYQDFNTTCTKGVLAILCWG